MSKDRSNLSYYTENLYAALSAPKGELVRFGPTGNSDAEVIMLVMPNWKTDCSTGKLFSSEQSDMLLNLMRHAGLSPEFDFFYLPVAWFGTKLSRAATKDTLGILRAVLKKKKFKLVVCLGGAAYSHMFTSGLKAKTHTIFGNLVYIPNWLGKVPMTVIPDIDPLIQPKTEENAWKIQRIEKEYAATYLQFLTKLKGYMNQLSPV